MYTNAIRNRILNYRAFETSIHKSKAINSYNSAAKNAPRPKTAEEAILRESAAPEDVELAVPDVADAEPELVRDAEPVRS